MRKITRFLTLPLLTFTSLCWAGVSSDMDSFFSGVTNVSSPGVSKSQMGGLYTGGSLRMRTPSKTITPVSISMPSYSGGCNGIDAFAGAFSFISSDQLVALGKAIASNAAPFAFDLAVKTLSPQIGNGIEQLRELANMVNQFQINSCEQAASLVANAWPFESNKRVQSTVCQTLGQKRGLFSDSAAAKFECDNNGKAPSLTASAAASSEFSDVLDVNTNAAWKAIKSASITTDQEMMELIMTMIGTVIHKSATTADGKDSYEYFPAKGTKDKFINGFLHGGDNQLEIYQCAETTNCLTFTTTAKVITIPENKSFVSLVRSMIESLRVTALDASGGEKLSEAQKKFLDRTNLPIYKMILVDLAYSGSSASALNPEEYSEVVALNYFSAYINELLEPVEAAVLQDMGKGTTSDQVKLWLDELRKVRGTIRQKIADTKMNFNAQMEMMQRTMQLEKVMSGEITNQVISAFDYSQQY